MSIRLLIYCSIYFIFSMAEMCTAANIKSHSAKATFYSKKARCKIVCNTPVIVVNKKRLA
jgi:hypothetical protein